MTAEMVPNDRSKTAADVIAAELEAIRLRRMSTNDYRDDEPAFPPTPGADADARLTEIRQQALDRHLVGVSLSGGGIRSGTFALGFLQGLASLGLLRRIDYLSTVSGGGYAGAWLAAWLKREGDVANVERQLDPNRVKQAEADRVGLAPELVVDEEPEPLFHLREYSSYLTARPGLLTADTWSVIAIWLRNVTVNLMMLLPMTMVAVLLARIVVYLYDHVGADAIRRYEAALAQGRQDVWLDHWPYLLGGVALLVAALALLGLTAGRPAGRGRWLRLGPGLALLAGGIALVAWALWDSRVALQWALFGTGLAALLAGNALNAIALGEFRTRAGGANYHREDIRKRLPGVAVCLLVLASLSLTIPLRSVIWSIGAARGDGTTAAATAAGAEIWWRASGTS